MKRIFSILFAVVLAVSLMLVPAASVGASPGPGIVGLWHFDGNANDSSGNGNDGTASGTPGWVSDQWTGQALSCSGDDYVSVPDDDDLDISGSIMVEAWVKVTSLTSGKFYTVAGKWNDVDGNYRAYLLGITAKTTTPEFRFYISSNGTTFDFVASSHSVNTGTWYHLAGSFDGDILTICVNGTVDTNDTSLSSIATNSEPLLIGGNKAGGATAAALFNGLIDEVRIWDTATRSFVLDAEPEEDFNPQDTQHTITATVEISKVGGGTTPAPGETVNFDVTGANPQSGSDDTDSSGVATFTYTGSMMGTDTINAWVDQDWSGDFNSANDAWDEVTKTWLEHFVTGGGIIREGEGKNAYSITFGGNVGYDLAGNEVGQWNINFHNVNDPAIDKGHFHSTEITDIGFFDIVACPEPDPPDADYNYAHFVATGRFNGEDGWEVRFNMTDYGEGNKTEPDGIRVRLWDASHVLVYDSSETGEHYTGVFTNEGTCALARRTGLDGGNIQIHPPEMPTP